MTLIVSHQGILTADHRGTNGSGCHTYLTATNKMKKMVTFPYGAYGVSGANPLNEKYSELMDTTLPMTLATISALTWIEKKFNEICVPISGLKVYDMLARIEEDTKIEQIKKCGLFTILRGFLSDMVYYLSDITDYHILAVADGWQITASPDYKDMATTHQCFWAVGSGAEAARLILSAGGTVDDVYKYTSKAGIGVSRDYDVYDTKSITLQPSILSYEGLFCMIQTLSGALTLTQDKKYTRAVWKGDDPSPEECNQIQTDLMSLLRFVWSHGQHTWKQGIDPARKKAVSLNHWRAPGSAKINLDNRRVHHLLPGCWDYVRKHWTTSEECKLAHYIHLRDAGKSL